MSERVLGEAVEEEAPPFVASPKASPVVVIALGRFLWDWNPLAFGENGSTGFLFGMHAGMYPAPRHAKHQFNFVVFCHSMM